VETEELCRQSLVLTAPWTVERVESDVIQQEVKSISDMRQGSDSPVPNAGVNWASTTILENGCGAIWTVASS